MLRLLLFGAPRLEQNGQIVPLRRSKALALLAYLALTRRPQDRNGLLALLWPEFDAASARNNLRRELSLLKATLGEEILLADRMQVSYNAQAALWVDVVAFQEQAASSRRHDHPPGDLCAACAEKLAAATRLAEDDFMAGFDLADSSAFEEWQFFQREQLRQQLSEALQALIGWHGRGQEYVQAIEYARRWLALDPLHEPAQRELIRLYALSGQQSAALRQYTECVRLLGEELGVEPEPKTIELQAQIRSRAFPRPGDTRHGVGEWWSGGDRGVPRHPLTPPPPHPLTRSPAHPLTRSPTHNLPHTTGFVGRKRELADLLRRLTDPDCRLLTLVGPGGIGKTRLALEAVRILTDEWADEDALADGVLFVPLAAVNTSSGLVAAIAAAARFDFYPNISPHQQLLDYFRTKRMLLLLDNLEQLLGEISFIADLLTAAPGLRVLATSRVALNLQEEWFHPIEGLAYPAVNEGIADVAQLARFDAVRLFERHARRALNDFSLNRVREPVVRLCRLVEGMPLALELAAGWLKLLSAEQVAAALEHNLDILTARDNNVPDRHRSIRVVLEESWRLLSAQERQTLARLSIFAGGFSAEAAEAVCGELKIENEQLKKDPNGVAISILNSQFSILNLLAVLVDKSLVRAGASGRFQLHELLRQFAAEQLAKDPQLAHITRERHSAYYLAFLAEREARLEHHDQHAAAEIAREAANVRAAWLWAVEHGDAVRIDGALASYYSYYMTRNSYQEGDEIFDLTASGIAHETASTSTPAHKRVSARASIRLGTFRYFLGDYASAVQHLEPGQAAAHELGLQYDLAYAHLLLGLIARWRGDAATARQRLGDALALSKAIGDQVLAAQTLGELGSLAGSRGDYPECARLAQESLAITRACGRADLAAHNLDTLGWSAVCRGDYQAAEAYYRESLELFERIGDQGGIAHASGGLGWVAWCIGGDRLEEARQQIERSLTFMRRRGQRLWIANFLGDMGMIAIDSGDSAHAWACAQEGLAIAREIGSPIYTAYHLNILGHVAAARQEFEAGRRYLGESLRIASDARQPTRQTFVLYDAALALTREAAHLGPGHPTYSALRMRAVELIGSVMHYPAAWHVCRARAGDLLEELRRELAPDLVEAAIARGRSIDWEAAVTALLDELANPVRTLDDGR